MSRSLCILLAFFILSCGDKSTGPVIEPEPIPNHETGDLVVDLPGGAKMAFIWVEPGTLRMAGYLPIEIPNGYYLGKYELTQQQWEQVMLTSQWPRKDEDGDGFPELDYPAYNISWSEAGNFAQKLTALQNDGGIYRLPTRDEWEYASRAGAMTPYFFGSRSDSLSDYAWWDENTDSVQIVGTKLPNPWGFYDIYGNVSEWTETEGATSGYPVGLVFYLLGGSYNTTPAIEVSSIFFIEFPGGLRHPEFGVRILREGPKILHPEKNNH